MKTAITLLRWCYRRAVPRGLLLLAILCGCNLYAPYSCHFARVSPRKLVVICPPGRNDVPGVRQHLDFKRSQGFDVETLVVDKDRDLPELPQRLAAIQRAIPGQLYALILATVEEIPMGDWSIEGLEEPIRSDLPYFLGQPVSPDKVIADRPDQRPDLCVLRGPDSEGAR